VPKALVEVAGRPFVEHQLALLARHGVRRVVLCVGHLGEQVERHVADGSRFGLEVAFSFEKPRLLGTAGALRYALPLVGDRFFVLYGDAYLPCAYRVVGERFNSAGKAALMTVFRNADRWDRSNVEFANGVIVRYDKRVHEPSMHHIDYGLGVLSRAAIELVPAGQPYDLERLYQRLLERGELVGFEVYERFYEVGSFSGIRDLSAYLSAHRRAVEAR
jgi:NDP-sugar pyrophosphorylase family protein